MKHFKIFNLEFHFKENKKELPQSNSFLSITYSFFLFALILGAGVIELQIGFRQWFNNITGGHPWHIIGSFDNPGPYGGFLAIILPFALYIVFHSQIKSLKNKKWTIILKSILLSFAWINLIGILIILPLTLSRSAWLAGLTGCICVISPLKIKKWFKNFNRKYQIIFLITCITIIIYSGIAIYKMKAHSADGRILIWKISLQATEKNWLTGNGWSTFPGIYGNAQALYFTEKKRSEHEQLIAGSPEYCFNEYIQIILEQGIIGILVLGGISYFAFRNLQRTELPEAAAFKAALIVILIFACFSYPFRIFHLCLLIAFVFGISICLPVKIEYLKHWYYKISSFLFILCVLLLTCYSFKIIGHPATREAEKYWQKLQPYFYRDEFKDVVDKYATLYPYLQHNQFFLFEYGQCLSQTGAYQKSNEILKIGSQYSSNPIFYNIMGKNYQEMGQYKKAEVMFYQAIARIPHRIYPYFLLMNMYVENDQVDKAKKIAQYIVSKKVKIISTETDSIKNKARQILSENN